MRFEICLRNLLVKLRIWTEFPLTRSIRLSFGGGGGMIEVKIHPLYALYYIVSFVQVK